MMSTVSEVMTSDPICLDESASVLEAAKAMRDNHIGNVIVTQGGRVLGILTDRDIVVRCVAQDQDVRSCSCGAVASRDDVATIAKDAPLEKAIARMRERAVRRLVVVDDETPVGVLSLGDLAQERDRTSALGEISAAAPNL
jgi:CBS domain-containing protein